ncbi:winged helix-turn-helix transcriptional regulator [Microbacterium amylolyticum]|uniref:DNA-binding HxlR family transcriptional regulator n=1 Tax=Microbacterium amylolyticum TaxID=936337 RepID=A0ABS4ZF65_9MICO|nr:helix-turn-helix domain-containing protein [Microbacterium amylolyticum]MBP2435921.1 DNA-binding HxlR family transcriptional regulator [Microbacterium amylolyticum]
MAVTNRSGCPINLAIELFGDRWSLLILRDMIFANRRHFRELLRESDEKMTSSILADRLERLVEAGILTRDDDPSHKQKALYTLTNKGIDLVPVLATIGIWGASHCPADPEKTAATRDLDYQTPESWSRLMSSLRATHGIPTSSGAGA